MIRRRPKAIQLSKHDHFEDYGLPLLIEIPFGELVLMYRNLLENFDTEADYWNANASSRQRIRDTIRRWKTEKDFYGGIDTDMLRYIDRGYRTGSLLGNFLPGVLRTRDGSAQRGRWLWNDSGDEIDVGLALSGDAQPFRSFESAPTAGGLNIRAMFSFAANTDHNIIAAYGGWIARLLATCSGAGVSPALSVDQYGTRLTNRHSGMFLLRTRVKQENEALDWHRYSCLFSPTGYRHLGFTALMFAGGSDLIPGVLASGLGHCVSGGAWELKWDLPTRTLTVYAPSHPHEFPADEMTKQLVATGALDPQGAMI